MRAHLGGHIRPRAWVGLAAETARSSYFRLIRHGTLRRQMRPVSWAHMATSTRFRAPSFRMRLARWALTVLGLM